MQPGSQYPSLPGQIAIDFAAATPAEQARRIVKHLAACGYSRVQAGLAGLVVSPPRELLDAPDDASQQTVGGKTYKLLRTRTCRLARMLGCSPRAVGKAAARLDHAGLLRVVKEAADRPPVYVLDVLAARSVATGAQLAIEAVGLGGIRTERDRPGPTGTEQDRPGPTGTGPDRALLVEEDPSLKSLSSLDPCPEARNRDFREKSAEQGGGGPARSGSVRVGPPGAKPVGRGEPIGRTTAGLPLWERPWAQRGGMQDREIRWAVGREDLEYFQHAFAELAARGWLAGGPLVGDEPTADRRWLVFLTICHHVVTTDCRSPKAVLTKRVKAGLDTSRIRQASDDWAGRMLALRWRDPALARRLMTLDCEE